VTEFKHEERLSRQRAAERLADIAYALAIGGTLEIRTGRERVRVPVAENVLVTREASAHGHRVVVEVKLTWRA
jgi:amphi-Trp domain-containing protein